MHAVGSFQGTNAVKRRVAVVDGKVEARPVMPGTCHLPPASCFQHFTRFTALTYDHRLVDGREAVTFLCSVRDKLEDTCGAANATQLLHSGRKDLTVENK